MLHGPWFRPAAGIGYEHMFSAAFDGLLLKLSDAIDDMLLGDYTYVTAGDRLYADVDYYRKHPGAAAERQPPTAVLDAAGAALSAHRDGGLPPLRRRGRNACDGAGTACTPAAALRSRC